MGTLSPIQKLDSHRIPNRKREIRAFTCIKNENLRLPFLIEHHREIGVDRFFFIDNGSTDGSLEYLMEQADCHVFACEGNFFADNVDPPVWTNALRNVHGSGHWCLSLDADEMFIYPHRETLSLGDLCDFLDSKGVNAVTALVIDMYGDHAIADARYERGASFLDYCPYFDSELGYEVAADGCVPPVLMFSRFRERVFWNGKHKKTRPPCITQVPLVKWSIGMAYLVAQHSLNRAVLSDLRAGVLHFKFLPGFRQAIETSIAENAGVAEKGLEERKTYIDTLDQNPELSLMCSHSVRYEDSLQLRRLGWLKSSEALDAFASNRAGPGGAILGTNKQAIRRNIHA